MVASGRAPDRRARPRLRHRRGLGSGATAAPAADCARSVRGVDGLELLLARLGRGDGRCLGRREPNPPVSARPLPVRVTAVASADRRRRPGRVRRRGHGSWVRLVPPGRVGAERTRLHGREAREPDGLPERERRALHDGSLACARRRLSPRAPVVVRALALATATFLAQLAFLCQSRGALFAVPVLVLAMLVLVPGRLRTSVAVALPLVAIALAREPLLDVYAAGESQPRLADALPGAAWAMLASAAAVGVAGALWGLVDRRVLVPVRLSRALGLGFLAAAVAVAAIAVPRLDVGDRLDRGWSQFTGKAAETTPRRGSSYLAYGLSGNRYDLWSVGMRQFRARPIVGEGVDNFAVAYLRERRFDEAAPLSAQCRASDARGPRPRRRRALSRLPRRDPRRGRPSKRADGHATRDRLRRNPSFSLVARPRIGRLVVGVPRALGAGARVRRPGGRASEGLRGRS